MTSDFRIGFLVYASRSGSTFLGARLQEGTKGLHVTPELKFHGLLRRSTHDLGSDSIDDLTALLTRRGALRNLELEDDRIRAALSGVERTHDAVLRAVLESGLTGSDTDRPDVVVVKQGIHARCWREIQARIPGAFLLFVRRDPRAVVASKMRTVRPYFPGEVMGWAGPAANAAQWVDVERRMERAASAGLPVVSVRYEDLITRPRVEIERLAETIGVEVADPGQAPTYSIPEAERGIHTLAHSAAQGRRIDAWRSELSAGQIAAIEAVAGPIMTRAGYDPTRERSAVERAVRVLAALPPTAARVVRHLAYHAARGVAGAS